MPASVPDSTSKSAHPYSSAQGLNAYHITTPLLILFSLLRTIFGLDIIPADYGAATPVFEAMHRVYFPLMGSQHTLGQFYTGYSIFVTIHLALCALLSWHLSRFERAMRRSRELRAVEHMLLVAMVSVSCVCWTYFFAAPKTMSTVITGLLVWEYLKG